MSQSSLSIGFNILICLLHKCEQPFHPPHSHTQRKKHGKQEKRKKREGGGGIQSICLLCHLTPAAPAFKPLPHSHYMLCCLLEELTCLLVFLFINVFYCSIMWGNHDMVVDWRHGGNWKGLWVLSSFFKLTCGCPAKSLVAQWHSVVSFVRTRVQTSPPSLVTINGKKKTVWVSFLKNNNIRGVLS